MVLTSIKSEAKQKLKKRSLFLSFQRFNVMEVKHSNYNKRLPFPSSCYMELNNTAMPF